MPDEKAKQKLEALQARLKEMGSVVVGLSGGVDSTFLLKVAVDTLGDDAVAITAKGAIHPQHEIGSARELAEMIGTKLIEVENLIDQDMHFAANPPNHCYLCKRALFGAVMRTAQELGYAFVIDGSNVDDLGDYRPGRQALKELGVQSPMADVGLTKKEIRELSRQMGLPTWNRPSLACLASRVPYGTKITRKILANIDKGEDLLRETGLTQVRLRYHGDIARIEVSQEEMHLLFDEKTREAVVEKLKALGFKYVTLDLQGYRTGSLNEGLEDSEGS